MKRFVEPALRVCVSAAKGRLLSTTTSLPAGLLIQRSIPYAAISCEPYKSYYCETCLSTGDPVATEDVPLSGGAFGCDDCQGVWYCSKQCQQENLTLHQQVCAPLLDIRSNDTVINDTIVEEDLMSSLRLVLYMLLSQPRPEDCSSELLEDLGRDSIDRLVGDYAGLSVESKLYCDNLVQLVRKFPALNDHSNEYLSSLVAHLLCNGFGIWNSDNDCYGYAIYPTSSFYNHSCDPNVGRVQVGTSLEFYTLRDILPNEELCISYIDPRLTKDQRVSYLQQDYMFECGCERCLHDAPLPSTVCPVSHLRHGSLIPVAVGSSTRKCNLCGHQV
eukprot:gnl/Hemi2/2407_TR848_c0_g1_i1.p1 gnl/Hemi2/2407_TR848_c0_g1~~gnl/Hemi2/2407_TR848_c0_g1_i1.p1  ORF type:complete len:331 (-),score=43.83 gnl/Hemi2/2407_TR848_c0_g1_i1:170-1162(-)